MAEEIKVTAINVFNHKNTKKGDPQKRVETEKGELLISGTGVLNIQRGDKLSITEPTQFGRYWYARLNGIEKSNGKASALAAVVAEKPSLNDIFDVIKATLNNLPDAWQTGDSIQGPRACAQIINTIIMGIGSGQIVLDAEPDLPGDGTPPPDEKNLPPWERD